MKEGSYGTSRPKRDVLPYKIIDFVLRSALRVLPPWNWSERLTLWWGFRFRPAPCVVKLRSGALIHVDPSDYLQLLIYYLGTFESYCLPYLKSCVSSGGTVVDVGANIGFYTLESSRAAGPRGHVIAIEAAPSNARALKDNIDLNQLTNATVINVAVGESTGSGTLSLSREGNLGMFTLGNTSGSPAVSYTVEVRRIDDILEENNISSVDLIKIDIEGSEYRALRGAVRTLQTCRPTILIELSDQALQRNQSSTKAVKELLRSFGYRGWIIKPRMLQPINPDQVIHDCDECLFVHCNNTPLLQKLGLMK